MRVVTCLDCRPGNRIVLRTNLRRAIRRHYINRHGPEVAPNVFFNATQNCVEFIDTKSRVAKR